MNISGILVRLAIGSWLVAGPVLLAQTGQTTATNSPAARTPPLPPGLFFATNAQRNVSVPQNTNRPQFPQVVRPGGASVAPGITRLTNLPALPTIPTPVYRPAVTKPPAQPLPLVADADVKEYTARPGDTNAPFTFTLTNTSSNAVTINEVHTSCGCTVAKLPSQPWTLAPGTNGQIQVTVDLRGKRGQLTKLVYVNGVTGTKTLTVKVNVPDAQGERAKNIQIATADRQAVFKNDCAKCHAEPATGKKGQALYSAACALCHDSEHRASMVPNLRALNHPTDREQWKTWITQGKSGTLMPAFAGAEGGPLTDEQIDSLVDYLVEQIPSRQAALPGVPRLPASQ